MDRRAQRSGYLTENQWSSALSMFSEIRSIEGDAIKGYAKDHIATAIRKNRAYLSARPELIQPLRTSKVWSLVRGLRGL